MYPSMPRYGQPGYSHYSSCTAGSSSNHSQPYRNTGGTHGSTYGSRGYVQYSGSMGSTGSTTAGSGSTVVQGSSAAVLEGMDRTDRELLERLRRMYMAGV